MHIWRVAFVMVAILVEAAFGVGSDVLLTNSLLTVTLVPEGGLIEITQTNSSETFTIQTLLITEMAKTGNYNSNPSTKAKETPCPASLPIWMPGTHLFCMHGTLGGFPCH